MSLCVYRKLFSIATTVCIDNGIVYIATFDNITIKNRFEQITYCLQSISTYAITFEGWHPIFSNNITQKKRNVSSYTLVKLCWNKK